MSSSELRGASHRMPNQANGYSTKLSVRNSCGIAHLQIPAERPRGVFSRQLFLGDNLDTDKIEANYHDGVLRLTIPVAEKAKPRRIDISHDDQRTAINA